MLLMRCAKKALAAWERGDRREANVGGEGKEEDRECFFSLVGDLLKQVKSTTMPQVSGL